MINAELIQNILSQYKKHGWNLRRVLLCDETRRNLADSSLEEMFGEAEIAEATFDAAWFSRPSKNEREAWELRHLTENPFALFETFGEDDDNASRDRVKREMETRLENIASSV